MVSVSRILCPVDFSDASRLALEYAVAMAKWYESKVTALHVFANVPVADMVTEFAAAGQVISLSDIDVDALRRELDRFVRAAAGDTPVCTKLEESIDIRADIVEQAAQLPADLIVIGTHGRRGFSRLMLGSVAESVLRKAECPVMAVPPHARPVAAERVPFKQILCPIDFSESSARALLFALMLAEEADAHLTLMHVIEMPPELRELANAEGPIDIAGVRAAAEADALQRLRALVPPSVGTYCTITTRVEEGKADREVLRVAAEEHPDVIVMGVQGRGALDLALFGSTTYGVVRGADCPVLSIRA